MALLLSWVDPRQRSTQDAQGVSWSSSTCSIIRASIGGIGRIGASSASDGGIPGIKRSSRRSRARTAGRRKPSRDNPARARQVRADVVADLVG